MRTRACRFVAAFTLATVVACPAIADQIVTFDLSNAKVDFTKATMNVKVTQSSGSVFDVKLENPSLTPVIRDTARLDGATDFNFLLDLTVTDLPGVDNWSASGRLTFTDTDKSSNAVISDFGSTGIAIIPTLPNVGVLILQGSLNTVLPNDAILQNRSDPWVFVGEQAIPGDLDADAVPGQITANNRDRYDVGALITLKFGVNTNSLDDLFSGDRSVDGAEVKGYIVPEPATAVLLTLGGLLLLRRRR